MRSGLRSPCAAPVTLSTSNSIRRCAAKPTISRSKSASELFSSSVRRLIISSVIVRSSVSVEGLATKPYRRSAMTTAMDKWPAAARLVAVAATGHLPTAPTPPQGTRPSRNLTARFVEQWKRGNPHGVVGDIGGKQLETNSEGATGAQDLAALVGRVMMSALFLWGGFANLTAAAQMDAYFSSLGLPFP